MLNTHFSGYSEILMTPTAMFLIDRTSSTLWLMFSSPLRSILWLVHTSHVNCFSLTTFIQTSTFNRKLLSYYNKLDGILTGVGFRDGFRGEERWPERLGGRWVGRRGARCGLGGCGRWSRWLFNFTVRLVTPRTSASTITNTVQPILVTVVIICKTRTNLNVIS